MKHKTIALLFVLMTAGCIIPNISSTDSEIVLGNSLEITNFEVFPNPVSSGSKVTVRMDIENLGDYTVPEEYGFVYFTGPSLTLTGEQKTQQLDKDMEAGNEIKGIHPSRDSFTWSFNAPSLEKGQKKTQTYMGRIYHNYETTVFGNLWVYSEAESRAVESSGKSFLQSSFDSGDAPIMAYISVSPNPAIIYDDKIITLSIRIIKVSSGTVYEWRDSASYTNGEKNIEVEELNKIDITIPGYGFNVLDDCEGEHYLVSGKELTMTCDLLITKSITTFDSIPIEVIIKYAYTTEKTTSIVVEGR